MGTPANSLNLTTAGIVRFNGVSVFTGETVTNHAVLVGAASNDITSVGPGTTNTVLLGNTGADPSFGAVPAGALPGSGQITLSNGTNISVTGSPVALGGAATINVAGPPSATTLTNHGVVIGQGTSAVVATAAGSVGQVLQSGGASADPTYSTATYPSTASGTGTILRANGTNWLASTSTYPNTNAVSTLLYASATNVMSALTTANNGTLVTSNTGVPSILAGPGTTGNVLQSNAAAAPSFSTATYPSVATGTGTILRADGTNWVATTATYPATTTINQILYSSSTNVVGGITAGNNGVLISGTTGIPSWLANGTTGQVLVATTGSPPSWGAASSGITITGDTGGALSPSGGNFNIIGGSNGIDTSGSGSTLTLNFDVTELPDIPTTFNGDSGSATPSGNIINILGSSGVTTSASGNTITVSGSGGGAGSAGSVLSYFQDFLMGLEFGATSSENSADWVFRSSATGTTIQQLNAESNRPGVITLGTGTTSVGSSRASQIDAGSTQGSLVLGGGVLTIQFYCKIPTLSDAGQTFTVSIGLSNTETPAANGLWFQYSHGVNSGKWQIIAANASSVTTLDSGVTVDTDWHVYKIVVNAAASAVSYYIDGVETSNSPNAMDIPTTAISPVVRITKSVGSTARQIYLDLYTSEYILTTPR